MNRHLKKLLQEGKLTIYTPKNVAEGQAVRALTQFYLIGDVIHQVNGDLTHKELETHCLEVERIVTSVKQSLSAYADIAVIISIIISALWTFFIFWTNEVTAILSAFKNLQWQEMLSLLWGYASFILPVLTKAVSRLMLHRLFRKYGYS